QQQRVAVARAVAGNPAIVLADEPTANLDSESSSNLMRLMRMLNQENSVTFLFSSHDPLVIERAERVIRLRDGETSILAGLIRDDERRTLEAVPGLSDLPLIGRLFARNRSERTETDIVITLTPHIVRVLDITENDLRPFRVGRDTGSPILDLLEPIRDEPAEPTAKPGTPPVIKD
nr:hypothetical protein [Vicinamibacterales bacterium]